MNYRSVRDREWEGGLPCHECSPSCFSHFANSGRSPYNYQAWGPWAAGSLVGSSHVCTATHEPMTQSEYSKPSTNRGSKTIGEKNNNSTIALHIFQNIVFFYTRELQRKCKPDAEFRHRVRTNPRRWSVFIRAESN